MAESSKIIGNYELLEEIGKGAEGRVHKAVCVTDTVPGVRRGELVALKRLTGLGHEKESQQFQRQIEILSQLKHPNIVSYKDSFVWREKVNLPTGPSLYRYNSSTVKTAHASISDSGLLRYICVQASFR